MAQYIPLGLNGMTYASQHYEKVWDPIHHKYKKVRGLLPEEDPDINDQRTMEEKGLVLKRRTDLSSDDEIVEVVRHKGQVLDRRPRRPGYNRRSSSVDGPRGGAMVPSRDRGRRGDDADDSEGSVPPRSRVRAKSAGGGGRRRRNASSSSSSSSDLGSSTGEEKEMKKMQRKKWLTGGLAAVATVHAASKVYSSIEAHDKRIEDVRNGTLSPEEAHKKQRSARWQDAAAIAIAALGIKGAISEWNEVQEEHQHHRELMEQAKEHHKKRLERERRKRAKERGGYYKGRDGNWYYNGPQPQSSESNRAGAGGRYDDNRLIEDSRKERKMIEDSYSSKGGRYQDDSWQDTSRAAKKREFKSSGLEHPKRTVRDLGVDIADELLGAI